MEDKKEMFVLKLPLKVEIWQEHILNKRFKYCEEIYNNLLRKIKRMLFYYQNSNEWKEIESLKDYKKKNKLIQEFIKKNNLPFSEFGITSYVSKFLDRYKQYGINSSILENIAGNLWCGLEKYLYGKGNKIAYKDTFNSYKIRVKGGRFNGIKCDFEKTLVHINLNGKQGKNAKFMTIPFSINPESEYEMNCFLPSNEIREIGIQREFIRGRWKYYIFFSIKGDKPVKNRQLGGGQVGIDLGPSSIAIVSNKRVYIDELGKGINNIENEIKIILRKLDRSRRKNNPLQFNDNGTIKKYPKGERPKWINSNNYVKLKNKLKELYRRKRVLLKLSHINLANEVLEYGDTFIVENNPIASWAKKQKETSVNKNGKIKSKKRFGKSIQNHAPSMFIEILKNKINSLGGNLTKIDIKNGASQFDFTNGEKTKHGLNVRRITLSNGNTHLRDTLSAFNLKHFKNNNYDVKEMASNYDLFCNLEKQEIQRHKGKKILKSIGIK